MTEQIPHAPELERAVIGAMLISGESRSSALDQLAGDDFHDPFFARIFRAIASLVLDGSAVDPILISHSLDVPATRVTELGRYAKLPDTIASCLNELTALAGFRRALAYAEDVRKVALAQQAEDLDELLTDPAARILPNYEPVEMPLTGTELVAGAQEMGDWSWVLPNLLARKEVWLGVGPAGYGKSTLLRQIGVCAASGLDPFTRVRTGWMPVHVLVVDCQEDASQAGLELAKLIRLAGDAYYDLGDTLYYECVPRGIDLSTRKWQLWLDAKVAKSKADLVILGPLYNMVRGTNDRNKSSEETAQLAMNALSDLMTRRDCALMIEAHAPHGEVQRPRGSKLWEDWPDFGHGLVIDEKEHPRRAFDVLRFRGDRHTERRWPYRYMQGIPGGWPWEGIGGGSPI